MCEQTAWRLRLNSPYRMIPSSAALQKVLGHMGAVAMRLTRFVWSENMWMVSFAVRSCTCTLVSAAPVIKIRSPEWGRNCKHTRFTDENAHSGTFTRYRLKNLDMDFTFTEKMLAACPVCIVMSLVCRKGSQMMACWSSEPEARRLERTNPVSLWRDTETWRTLGLITELTLLSRSTPDSWRSQNDPENREITAVLRYNIPRLYSKKNIYWN